MEQQTRERGPFLLLAGARTNSKTREGFNSPDEYTPLHIAAERANLAVVMLLVATGAKVDATNGKSATALDLAISSRHASVVKFLKKALK